MARERVLKVRCVEGRKEVLNMQTIAIDQLVGQVVGEREQYRLERLLGRNRLSIVYRARECVSQQLAAFTFFLLPERFSDETQQRFLRRFMKEAAGLITLQHPRILPTYAYGEYSGNPYLATPYMTNGSLADKVKQQGRLHHIEVLEILKQVAEGLEYAHGRGVVHGTLKPANMVFNDEQEIQVAGFGLMHILQAKGIEPRDTAYEHLVSIAGTFLIAPEYAAPEVVEGLFVDPRSDIYALGAILFELLSGTPIFQGADPYAVAQMQINQVPPSLRTLCPDIPLSLAAVVNQALMKDPDQRFQRISELVEAFTECSLGATDPRMQMLYKGIQSDSADTKENGNWQFVPPIVTGKLPAFRQTGPISLPRTSALKPQEQPAAHATPARPVANVAPAQPAVRPSPVVLPEPAASAPAASPKPPRVHVQPVARPAAVPPVRVQEEAMPSLPWWVSTPAQQEPEQPPLRLPASPTEYPARARAVSNEPPLRISPSTSKRKSRGTRQPKGRSGVSRRTVLATLAGGGVVAAGVLLATKMNLAGLNGTAFTTAPTTNTTGKQQTTGTSHTAPAKNTAAGHTGMVIADKNTPLNTAIPFITQADGKSNLLVHLPNGQFVAYRQACTHEQVSVHYDPGTHTFVCPAHGAIFDPANKGAVLQGPATLPLPMVAIRINADGTITV